MHRGLQELKDARVLFLDMNSFFASVEQQHTPSLRNRPIAVVSHKAPRGTVLAASYEAKSLGIKTGTKLEMAYLACPHLAVLEPNPARYKAAHHCFMRILHEVWGPEVQARSIDEAALFLTPNFYGSTYAWQLAQAIKDRFRGELGEYIRCSIGIAPNSLLAKVATNLKKPDGLMEIKLSDLETLFKTLPLTGLPGIAERSAILLAQQHIFTPLDLYQADPVSLYKQFGIWGQYWWWRLHGYEVDYQSNPAKSMSHQHVLKHWLKSYEEAWPVIMRMSDRLIHRLRKNNFQCQKVALYLSLASAPSLCGEHHFDRPVSQYAILLDTITYLFDHFPRPLCGAIRKICIGFYALTEETSGLQLDLFEQVEEKEALSQAIENIRQRFGFAAIQFGQVARLDQSIGREQIGFGRIKDRSPTS